MNMMPVLWFAAECEVLASVGQGDTVLFTTSRSMARCIVTAVNSHGELVDALRELTARCDGAEGMRADGSNIQTMRAHAILDKVQS